MNLTNIRENKVERAGFRVTKADLKKGSKRSWRNSQPFEYENTHLVKICYSLTKL